jgi:hypothetical protein
MSRLIAFGSSPIIYAPSPDPNLTNKTFTAIIAEHLGQEYLCVAKRWNSNSKIARKVISFEYQPDDTVFVVWSSTMRAEFRTENGWFGTNRDTAAKGGFEEAWYAGPGQWAYTSVMMTIKEMILVQQFLKTNNIKYFFAFDNNELLGNSEWTKTDPYLSKLTSILDLSCTIAFEGNNGFLNWCKDNNYEFIGGPNTRGYPAQVAHQAAADYILNNYTIGQ